MTIEHVQVGGARAVLVHEPALPLTAVSIRIDAGSRDDPDGKSGLAHVLEHMMSSGDRTRGRGEFGRWVQEMGGFTNAKTSADWTTYFHVVPSELVPEVLSAEASRRTDAAGAMREAYLVADRQIVLRERMERVTTPAYGRAIETLLRLAYPSSPYGRLPVGAVEDLSRLNLQDCREFLGQHYLAARVVMAVIGGFDAAAARDGAAYVLSAFPTEATGHAGDESYRIGSEAGPTIRVTTPARAGRRVFLGVPLPPSRLWDFDLAELGSVVLSQGMSAVLTRRLVHDERVAAQVLLRTVPRQWNRSLGIVEIMPEQNVSTTDVLARFDDTMESLSADGVPDPDITRARALYASLWSAADDAILSRADGLTLAMQTHGSVERYLTQLDRVAALDESDVRSAVAAWHRPTSRVEVVYE